jgi:hypothetical protein
LLCIRWGFDKIFTLGNAVQLGCAFREKLSFLKGVSMKVHSYGNETDTTRTNKFSEILQF